MNSRLDWVCISTATRLRSSRRRVGAAALVLSLCAGGASACSSGEEVQSRAPAEPRGEAPFVLGTGYTPSASMGDDLVFLNPMWIDDPKSPYGAVFRSDGSWIELPAPSEPYAAQAVASVGERVALVGAVCGRDLCEDGVAEFQWLSDDLTRWEPFSKPIRLPDGTPEMSAIPTPDAEFGVVSTTAGLVSITADGLVRLLPKESDRIPGGSTLCLVDANLVNIRSHVEAQEGPGQSGELKYVFSSAQSLDLSTPSANWSPLPLPPDGTTGASGGTCDSSGPVFLAEGVQASFDGRDGKWSGPSQVTTVAIASSAPATAAFDTAGNLYVLGIDGTVQRRTPDGNWVGTDVQSTALYSTGSAVYSVAPEATSLSLMAAS